MPGHWLRCDVPMSRMVWEFVTKPSTQVQVKQLLVQILVVVANIQMRTLKAEVEKVSVRTAIGHG